ncbi:MAG: WD40 repeat domain-containing protein [Proteobacteria bacterium]|nr:WD40 repeat domain-containing protein [Pseudomonadota bacterium]
MLENNTNFDELLRLAKDAVANNSYEPAAQYMLDALVIDQCNPILWLLIGETLFKDDCVDESIKCFKYVLTLNPNSTTRTQAESSLNAAKSRLPQKHKMIDSSSSIQTLSILPSGELVTGSTENLIRVWDLPNESCVREFRVQNDANYFGASIVLLWNTLSKSTTKQPRNHSNTADYVTSFAVSRTGELASGSTDKMIRIWNPSNGSCSKVLSGHSESVWALTFLPTGELVSGSSDNTIRIWDVVEGRCIQVLPGHTDAIYALCVLQSGVLVSGAADNTIRVWDVEKGLCTKVLTDHKCAVSALKALPTGELASGSWDNTIRIWNVAKGECVKKLTGHMNSVYSLFVLSSGELVSGSADNTIRVWDLEEGFCVRELTGHTDCVLDFLGLPNGELVSGARDGTIRVWNIERSHYEKLAIAVNQRDPENFSLQRSAEERVLLHATLL